MAFITRPDALLLIAPLVLDYLIQLIRAKESLRLRPIVAAALPPLLWYGFAWLYFGSPLPHSVQAKFGAYHLAPTEALIRLIQHYATPFFFDNWLGKTAVLIGLFLYPFLSVIAIRYAARQAQRLLPFLLYPWFYFVVFAAANPLIFRWYLSPPLPAYFLSCLLGGALLLNAVLDSIRPLPSAWLRSVLTAALLIALPLAATLSEWGWQPAAPRMAYDQLELTYRRAAEIVSPYLTAEFDPRRRRHRRSGLFHRRQNSRYGRAGVAADLSLLPAAGVLLRDQLRHRPRSDPRSTAGCLDYAGSLWAQRFAARPPFSGRVPPIGKDPL